MTLRSWLMPLAIGAITLALGLFTIWAARCPCDRLPGLTVSGEMEPLPVSDWTFVNDAGLCAVQVQSWRSHAIVLNCMSSQNQLYVSCSRCEGKYWSGVALENPEGLIKVHSSVFPVTLERVTDADDLDRIWAARAAKVGRDAGPRPDHWWSFNLTSRPPG